MEAELKGDKLVVTIPLEKGRPSASGRSIVRFSTRGFVELDGTQLKVNINVIQSVQK